MGSKIKGERKEHPLYWS